MAHFKYIPAGIRLHFQELVYKITNRLNNRYYIVFEDIPSGLKAEKILKKHNIKFKSIPIPDEIFEACGVALSVDEYKEIVEFLKKYKINSEVYEFKANKPVKVYGNLIKRDCGI